MNILQKNFINKPSYLALVHKSSYEELIKQLFLHEYKNSKANKAAFDISNVVNEIMNEIINLTLIKYKLLDEWLPEEEDRSNSGNMDETMTNFNLIKSWQKEEKHDVNRENEENYWRCVNILQVSLYEYWLKTKPSKFFPAYDRTTKYLTSAFLSNNEITDLNFQLAYVLSFHLLKEVFMVEIFMV